MISVLIPVFNSSVYALVYELSLQLLTNNLTAEIIVFDDYSEDSYRSQNKAIANLKGVYYKELERNYGRAEIRKLLASHANYKWLLYIDGDSKIFNKRFLLNYFEAIMKGGEFVLLGGRTYTNQPPEQCNKMLHWQYGRKRESIIGKSKCIFHSNNFCLKKSVFNQIVFPKDLIGYGHEDTWIGIQFELNNIQLKFIDNPVLHEGIESTEVFISKSDNAIYNLVKLSKLTDKNMLAKHVRLFKAFCKVKYLKLEWVVLLFFRLTKKAVLNSLQSCNPSLLVFDWYRLGKLVETDKKMKNSSEVTY